MGGKKRPVTCNSDNCLSAFSWDKPCVPRKYLPFQHTFLYLIKLIIPIAPSRTFLNGDTLKKKKKNLQMCDGEKYSD